MSSAVTLHCTLIRLWARQQMFIFSDVLLWMLCLRSAVQPLLEFVRPNNFFYCFANIKCNLFIFLDLVNTVTHFFFSAFVLKLQNSFFLCLFVLLVMDIFSFITSISLKLLVSFLFRRFFSLLGSVMCCPVDHNDLKICHSLVFLVNQMENILL